MGRCVAHPSYLHTSSVVPPRAAHLCCTCLIQITTRPDDTEEWLLPKAPRGMEVAGGRSKSGSKSKRTKATTDRPPTDIGKASPTSAEDAEYANDIMGGSDEEHGRASRSGSSSSGRCASDRCDVSA
eukprot:COSAG02_NODE_3017_length_7545_cov_4.558286_7_plen_127_part_00